MENDDLPCSHLVVWHCTRCGVPVTTWDGGRAWCCPGCGVQGAWAGDRQHVPAYCLAVGDERFENKRRS